MQFQELQQIVESNSRTIQAILGAMAEARVEREELRQATLGIANLLSSLDEDRPTVLRKLSNIETKLDRLLEQEGNGS
ncbi:MAG: hypothetical protein ACRCZS_00800 [Chroococcidiopsis sp.]